MLKNIKVINPKNRCTYLSKLNILINEELKKQKVCRAD